MRGKGLNIILLFSLLVVLLVVFLVFEKGEVKVVKKKKFLVGEFSSQDISFLSIRFRDYYDRAKVYKYVLFKSNDLWFVSYSNIVDRVDVKLGNFVANIIGDIESLDTVSSDEVGGVEIFGFNSPNAEIIFDVRSRTNKLVVGNLTPTKDYYYSVLNDDYRTVHLIYAYKVDNILKYPDEVRDRNVFTPDWTNVIGFEYKPMSGNEIFVFTNRNKVWYSLKPFDKEVDGVFVETVFLKDLRSIRVEQFVDVDDIHYRRVAARTNSPISYVKLYNGRNEFLLLVLTNVLTNLYCYDPQRGILFSVDYESTRSIFDSNYERFVKIDK